MASGPFLSPATPPPASPRRRLDLTALMGERFLSFSDFAQSAQRRDRRGD